MKWLKVMSTGRVMLLLSFILMSFVAISPDPWASGFEVKGIEDESSAKLNGLSQGNVIYSVGGTTVDTLDELFIELNSYSVGEIVSLETDTGEVSFVKEVANGFTVKEVGTSNLKKGLDLVGGVRVVLRPTVDLAESEIIDMIDLLEKRLNVFGVSDMSIRNSKDLEGTNYIIIEIAGASKEEIVDLVSKQGKFEAKIGDDIVFRGGKDIKSVCRSPECSGISYQNGCYPVDGGEWQCRHQFSVGVSQESAEKHSDITSKLSIDGGYLSEKLDLYLDDELVSSLFISEGLQGIVATTFSISGSATGITEEAAAQNAIADMKEMQTLLISGSLPYSVEVERVDVISASLGEKFFGEALLSIILAIFAVGGVIFARYRNLNIAIPMIVTGLSEVAIILGFAALIRWNLDLAAIAGIIAAVGTGVDDQIVITDEVMRGRGAEESWVERMKRAFFIIFAAYFTMLVAMLPLWFIGAGVLKGFALTTIIGVTIGVFITRPAFAKMIETLLE